MINLFSYFILAYFFIICSYSLLIFCISFFSLMQQHLRFRFSTPKEILKAKITPAVSILVPAYNEEKSIAASVKSLLGLEYNQFEVVVIDDGSKDGTLEVLRKEFLLKKSAQEYNPQIPTKGIKGIYRSQAVKNLVVIDKHNGGKADALNVGINVCSYPLFCCIDADSILEKHSLLSIVYPFMEAYSSVVATGGLIRAVNACRVKDGQVREIILSNKLLVNFQVLEYFRSFLSGRMGFSILNCLLIISGAFGLFKKQSVIEVGGYRHDTVGEDMELVVRLHHELRKKNKPCEIRFVPDPVCWTEVPEDLKTLTKQRNRWQRGLADSLFRHIGMMFNPRYGTIGFISMPYFFFVELLSPVVELSGYLFFIIGLVFGAVQLKMFLLFFALSLVFGIFLSLVSLMMEEIAFRRYSSVSALARLVLMSLLENFGYRQYMVCVRTRGIYDFLRGKKGWGEMKRAGIK